MSPDFHIKCHRPPSSPGVYKKRHTLWFLHNMPPKKPQRPEGPSGATTAGFICRTNGGQIDVRSSLGLWPMWTSPAGLPYDFLQSDGGSGMPARGRGGGWQCEIGWSSNDLGTSETLQSSCCCVPATRLSVDCHPATSKCARTATDRCQKLVRSWFNLTLFLKPHTPLHWCKNTIAALQPPAKFAFAFWDMWPKFYMRYQQLLNQFFTGVVEMLEFSFWSLLTSPY